MKTFENIKEGLIYFKHLTYIFVLLLIFFIISVAGYMIIEGYNCIEAFYMTVISITTAGYMEVHPLSDAGRLFTSFVLLTNI